MASKRHQELYVLRGVTIIAMVCYHAMLVDQFIRTGSFTGNQAAYPIALTFMFLSGVSISLVESKEQKAKRRAYRRTMFRLILCSWIITLVTLLVLPDYVIMFGILHLILFSYVVFFVKEISNSRYAHIVLIGMVFLLDYIRVTYIMSPTALDYTPIFPFFLVVLVGYFMGREHYGKGQHYDIFRDSPPIRFLAITGRYSLPIYIIHIPILYFLLGGSIS